MVHLQESQEIDHLNAITQNFPLENLLAIFDYLPEESADYQDILWWFNARLVSKSWCDALAMMDWFKIIQYTSWPSNGDGPDISFNWPHMLQLFHFSDLRLDGGPLIELNLLTCLKGIELSEDSLSPEEIEQIPHVLTDLTNLGLLGDVMPPEVLSQLTKLETLLLDNTFEITDLSPLTNLRHLSLHEVPQFTQAYCLETLPKLETLYCCTPSFFKKGKGQSFLSCVTYDGEWLNGKRHGQGVADDYWRRYEGSWVQDQRHGRGYMRWISDGQVEYYEGDWKENRITGEGKAIYSNGDIYQGGWLNGTRHLAGVYVHAATGRRLEGMWSKGRFLNNQDGNQIVCDYVLPKQKSTNKSFWGQEDPIW